jgi:hypothetical protein
MLPPPDEVLICAPTWVRGRGPKYHDADPVTLVMALEQEPELHHEEMVRSHLDVLTGWLEIGEDVLGRFAPEAEERVGVGFALLMFAAELSSALFSVEFGPQVVPEVKARCTEVIAQATLLAGGCLASTVSEYAASFA